MGELDPAEARAELWRRGVLSWKLHPGQQEIYRQFYASDAEIFVSHCGRRFGKSVLWLVVALELCIRKPYARVKYAAATQEMVKEIIRPEMRMLSADAPAEVRPIWRHQGGRYWLPNGSEIVVAGTDGGNIDHLRGPSMDLGIVDEAGFAKERLSYVVVDVLMPQTATTSGRIVLSSNSPRMVGHEFRQYATQAKLKGAYVHKTIHDNPFIAPAKIESLKLQSGGEQSTTWRREYLAEWVTDETIAVVPEFNERAQTKLVREHQRPEYFDAYVAMDVGFRDLTAVLFGYWDFQRAYGVIEDELALSRMTTEDLAAGIRDKEAALWSRAPQKRVSDTDLILIQDLNKIHGLSFAPTRKDDKDAAINAVRLAIQQDGLIIHPRCHNLIAHLENAVWNRNRTDYERSELFGHFDFVDALVYWWRALDQQRNPYPAHVADIQREFVIGRSSRGLGIGAELERAGRARAS